MAIEIKRRQFQRIKYPEDCRPELLITQKEGEIKKCWATDISEWAISFIGNIESELQYGQSIEAQITFPDGGSVDVKGKWIRIIGNQAVIYLFEGIPPSRITIEQIFLKNRQQS